MKDQVPLFEDCEKIVQDMMERNHYLIIEKFQFSIGIANTGFA